VEEEKKGEQESTRRSARNFGKEANYNIDDLLDAADEEMIAGGKGSGCISVMLA